MSKKKTNEQRPYLVDKLAQIPAWVKCVFLNFWGAGATFYLVFNGVPAISGLNPQNLPELLDLLLICFLVLTLVNEYIVQNLTRYMDLAENPTTFFYIHHINKKKLLSLAASTLYSLLMLAGTYSFLVYFWVGLLKLHTIDFYLSGAEAGPIMFAIIYLMNYFIYLFAKYYLRIWVNRIKLKNGSKEEKKKNE